jgi:tryptophanyl-tRNA synthetase
LTASGVGKDVTRRPVTAAEGTIVGVRIFSGIQPTGAKHLGNYSGGFRQYAALQAEGETFLCIVDLHSITVRYDPDDLRARTLDLGAMLFATGMDPRRATVFVQSHVTAHPEGAWLLGAVTSVGELRRMTQFKDKAEQQEFVSADLFTYPVLMAADILLYRPDRVPIGDDQRQHLELARDIAARFNARFGETFVLPEGILPEVGARIMDLQEPTRKMSTTGGSPLGTVHILDDPEVISAKFKSAVTDSGRDVHRAGDKPGISNLIEIMAVATGESPAAVEARYAGQGYGRFKADVGDAVVALFTPLRKRYQELRDDPAELGRLLARGAERAQAASAPMLQQMYDRMGFVAPRLP